MKTNRYKTNIITFDQGKLNFECIFDHLYRSKCLGAYDGADALGFLANQFMDSIIAHVDAIKSKPKQSDIALIHSSLEVLQDQDSMKKQVGAIEKALNLNNTAEINRPPMLIKSGQRYVTRNGRMTSKLTQRKSGPR
jgi:hypothetical protein